jgi:hypothetical protein
MLEAFFAICVAAIAAVDTAYSYNKGGGVWATLRPSRGRCPYCLDDLPGTEAMAVRCTSCAARLHGECWTEHGRCAIFGCSSKTKTRLLPLREG